MRTQAVTFSGVHGAGKTTILNAVANRLRNIGMKVYCMPEFPYIPDIKIGTMDFQAWCEQSLRERTVVLRKIIDMNYFDIILLDRHPLDVEVYSRRIRGDPDDRDLAREIMSMALIDRIPDNNMSIYYSPMDRVDYYLISFVIERPVEDIIASVMNRRKTDVHRKEWNEENEQYIKEIIEGFQLFERSSNTISVINTDLEASIDYVFERIIVRLSELE